MIVTGKWISIWDILAENQEGVGAINHTHKGGKNTLSIKLESSHQVFIFCAIRWSSLFLSVVLCNIGDTENLKLIW